MSKPEPCESAGFLIYGAARQFMRSLDKELKVLGITAAQLAPLLLLSTHGTLLQKQIVKLSAVEQPAMVAMLTKLGKDGYILRRVDTDDARALRFSLTASGRRLVAKATACLRHVDQQSMTGFTALRSATLAESLKKVIANLGPQTANSVESARGRTLSHVLDTGQSPTL